MLFSRFVLFASLGLACCAAPAPVLAQNGVLGIWTEPTGSSISVERCSTGICLRLVAISRKAPTLTDDRNPDPTLRSRPLCGLRIGNGFSPDGEDKAGGGTLYDPKSGKTYKGSIARDGNELRLRGYVGVKLFGVTETWVPAGRIAPCNKSR